MHALETTIYVPTICDKYMYTIDIRTLYEQNDHEFVIGTVFDTLRTNTIRDSNTSKVRHGKNKLFYVVTVLNISKLKN